MNRVIKFRLRDENNKIVGYEKWENGRWVYSEHKFLWTVGFITHAEKDQFTDFHDKNGKEIYEDDIFSDGFKKYSVKFEDGVFGFLSIKGDRRFYPLYIFTKRPVTLIEVIGNKFENPELLETDE